MGAVYKYHITMLISGEQEDAIRLMFKANNWPCWLKVLSDVNVANMVEHGYTEIFPELGDGQDGGIGRSVFTEIKSEVVDVDTEEDSAVGELLESPAKLEQPIASDDDNTMDYDMAASAKNVSNTQSKSKTQNDNKGTTGKFPCTLCEISCVTRTILRRHYRRRHQGMWLEFECNDCSCKFKTKDELWEHRREVNHEPPKEKPKAINVDRPTPEELASAGHLKCEICSNYYPHRRSLRRHLYKVHRESMPKWNCPICGAEYGTRDELWKHKREKQHKTNIWTLGNYQCDSCGKIYSRYDSFTEHKISCEKTEGEKIASRKYPCDVCGLVFKSVIRVKAHKRGVHVVAPVVCHVCGAMCKNKRALLVHRRRHDMKNKKYMCDDCGKSFFNSTLLSQHVRTHTKEKPYKCPRCSYTCAIKQNIHKHSEKVHKTQYKAVPADEGKSTERSVHQSDDIVHGGQNFGIVSMLEREAQALLELQKQSQELYEQHHLNSSIKVENSGAKVEPKSEFSEIIDYSLNESSYTQPNAGQMQYQYHCSDPSDR